MKEKGPQKTMNSKFIINSSVVIQQPKKLGKFLWAMRNHLFLRTTPAFDISRKVELVPSPGPTERFQFRFYEGLKGDVAARRPDAMVYGSVNQTVLLLKQWYVALKSSFFVCPNSPFYFPCTVQRGILRGMLFVQCSVPYAAVV